MDTSSTLKDSNEQPRDGPTPWSDVSASVFTSNHCFPVASLIKQVETTWHQYLLPWERILLSSSSMNDLPKSSWLCRDFPEASKLACEPASPFNALLEPFKLSSPDLAWPCLRRSSLRFPELKLACPPLFCDWLLFCLLGSAQNLVWYPLQSLVYSGAHASLLFGTPN